MIRKSERDKKKLMDTILKRLRTLNGDLSGASTQSWAWERHTTVESAWVAATGRYSISCDAPSPEYVTSGGQRSSP